MSTELSTAATHIYSKITGDATLAAAVGNRVYEDAAPSKTVYPCIVFSCITPNDSVSVGGVTIKSDLDYTIKVVGQNSSYALIDPVAARLKAVLHHSESGNVLSCIREKPFNRSYELNGVQYHERGGIYRIMIQGA